MTKKKYALLNLFGGTRLDIDAEDLTEAASSAVQLLFDLDKKWEAKELMMKNKAKAIEIKGFNNQDGKSLTVIVAKAKVVDTTKDLNVFKKLK
jgi:ACT domain-containing protein